jgi:flagellar motor switch protein FliN/FliY
MTGGGASAPGPAAATPAAAASGAFADNPIDASEIDALLREAATFADPTAMSAAAAASGASPAAGPTAPAAGSPAAASTPNISGLPDQASIEELLRQATFEDPGAPGADMTSTGGASQMAGAEELKLPNFSQVIQDAQVSSIDLLRDVELNVKIELGRSRMLVEDVLRLAEGSVVELDKLAGDPVDVFVNERLVARGEVLVLNDNFCVRVNEIVTASKEEGL